MTRIIIYEAVFILSFAAGIFFTTRFKNPLQTSRLIFVVEIYLLQTIIYICSMWKLDVRLVAQLFKLFASYGALIFIMMGIGYFISFFLKQTAAQRGAFVNAAAYSNIGMGFGGVVCFLLLGETGIALANICVLALILISFTAGIFLSSYWGEARNSSWPQAIMRSFKQPMMWAMIGSLGLGIALNYAGLPRPAFIDRLMPVLVFGSLILTTFATGIGLKFTDLFACPRDMAAIHLVKFAVTPAVALLLSIGLSLHGQVRSVMLVEATMPCAVTAVMFSRLFGLDHRLANALWLGTTVGALVIVPVMMLLGWHKL